MLLELDTKLIIYVIIIKHQKYVNTAFLLLFLHFKLIFVKKKKQIIILLKTATVRRSLAEINCIMYNFNRFIIRRKAHRDGGIKNLDEEQKSGNQIVCTLYNYHHSLLRRRAFFPLGESTKGFV